MLGFKVRYHLTREEEYAMMEHNLRYQKRPQVLRHGVLGEGEVRLLKMATVF
jgi:hypothetical protein